MPAKDFFKRFEKAKDDKYMPTLDGIRGLACLFVVFSHLNYPFFAEDALRFNFGNLGVTMFFCLSGFLMGKLYLFNEFNEHTVVNYGISRISRILPAYYIAITLAVVIYQFFPDFGFKMTPIMILRSYAFLGTAGVFWSIPPEVQFYGFFILIWLALFLFNKYQKLWPMMAVGLTIILFFVTRLHWPGFVLPFFIHIFVLGVFWAYLSYNETASKIIRHIIFQIGLISVLVVYLAYFAQEKTYQDLPLIFLVSLSIFSLSQTTFLSWIFTIKPLRFIGAASFSIYLLHGHIEYFLEERWLGGEYDNVLQLVIIFSIMVILPCIFYIYIEKPLHGKTKNAMHGTYKYITHKKM